MPTSTFYNLKTEKRERIMSSVRKEFARVELKNMSVKNIVEDAKIARGSFYQYFPVKEDLIQYVLDSELERERKLYYRILEENNGDIFDSTYKYLKELATDEKIMADKNYYKHILEEMRKEKIFPLKIHDMDDVISRVNMNLLELEGREQVEIAIRILMTLLHATKIGILYENVTVEDSLKEFKVELDLLKKGMSKI